MIVLNRDAIYTEKDEEIRPLLEDPVVSSLMDEIAVVGAVATYYSGDMILEIISCRVDVLEIEPLD